MPTSQKELLGMMPFDPECEEQQTINHEKLAKLQGTRYAVVPVHTREEMAFFKELLKSRIGETINWVSEAQKWNDKANGRNIFYKTAEALKAYYKHYYRRRLEEASERRQDVEFATKRARVEHTTVPAARQFATSVDETRRRKVSVLMSATTIADAAEANASSSATVPPAPGAPVATATLVAPKVPAALTVSVATNNQPVGLPKHTRKCAHCRVAGCPGVGGQRHCTGMARMRKRKRRRCKRCGDAKPECPGSGNRLLCVQLKQVPQIPQQVPPGSTVPQIVPQETGPQE